MRAHQLPNVGTRLYIHAAVREAVAGRSERLRDGLLVPEREPAAQGQRRAEHGDEVDDHGHGHAAEAAEVVDDVVALNAKDGKHRPQQRHQRDGRDGRHEPALEAPAAGDGDQCTAGQHSRQQRGAEEQEHRAADVPIAQADGLALACVLAGDADEEEQREGGTMAMQRARPTRMTPLR